MPRKKKIKESPVSKTTKKGIEKLPTDCVVDAVRVQEKVNELIDKVNG